MSILKKAKNIFAKSIIISNAITYLVSYCYMHYLPDRICHQRNGCLNRFGLLFRLAKSLEKGGHACLSTSNGPWGTLLKRSQVLRPRSARRRSWPICYVV